MQVYVYIAFTSRWVLRKKLKLKIMWILARTQWGTAPRSSLSVAQEGPAYSLVMEWHFSALDLYSLPLRCRIFTPIAWRILLHNLRPAGLMAQLQLPFQLVIFMTVWMKSMVGLINLISSLGSVEDLGTWANRIQDWNFSCLVLQSCWSLPRSASLRYSACPVCQAQAPAASPFSFLVFHREPFPWKL